MSAGFTYIRAVGPTVRQFKLKPNQANVVRYIACRASATGESWASVRTIALDCGYEVDKNGRCRPVAKILADLTALGILTTTKKGHTGRATVRQLHLVGISECAQTSTRTATAVNESSTSSPTTSLSMKSSSSALECSHKHTANQTTTTPTRRDRLKLDNGFSLGPNVPDHIRVIA